MKPKVPHPLRDPASNLCDIIKYGYFHQLRLLICTGIDLECRDSNRRTPIVLCALMEPEAWGIGIARNLIENNVRVYRRDKFGRNVFHYACIYERLGLIQVLLKAMDFDLNQTDKLGNTALHYAALSGNIVVTQIIARAFKRYKIHPGKTNKRGYTAREEAVRTGNSKCGHAIEQEMVEKRPGSGMKDVRFADEVVEEQNTMKGHRSSFNNNHHVLSSHNNRTTHAARPWSTPAISRPDSSLSSMSMEERLSTNSFRSRSNLSYGGSCRKSSKTLVAMGIRHDDDVIHCAEADDFRNKPDFVFKMVHLHYDASDWHPVLAQDLANRKTAWNETKTTSSRISPTTQTVMTSIDWRQDLKSLFKVYESQCSASWRAAQRGKSLSQEEQERLAAEIAEEDEKGKKPRRFSSNRAAGGPGNKEPVPELKRRMSTTRMRRRSSIHGLALGKMTAGGAGAASSMDGSLNTSNESISSQISTHKRRGSDRELLNPQISASAAHAAATSATSASRSEGITNRSGLRRPSTDSRFSSSPSPTIPQLIVPDITNSKKSPSSKSSTTLSSKSQSLQQQQQQKQQQQRPATSENPGRLNRRASAVAAHNIYVSSTHAQVDGGGDSSSKQQEVSKSRGRKASLIMSSPQSLGRKNDDTDVKINGNSSNIGNGISSISNNNTARGGRLAARESSASRVESNEKEGNSGSVLARKMTVPRVKESLVEDRRLSVDYIAQSKPDTSRLWVQNPYADDEGDDDDDYDDNISEYDYESAIDD